MPVASAALHTCRATAQFMPAMPTPLLPTPAAMPDTCVPWVIGSLMSLYSGVPTAGSAPPACCALRQARWVWVGMACRGRPRGSEGQRCMVPSLPGGCSLPAGGPHLLTAVTRLPARSWWSFRIPVSMMQIPTWGRSGVAGRARRRQGQEGRRAPAAGAARPPAAPGCPPARHRPPCTRCLHTAQQAPSTQHSRHQTHSTAGAKHTHRLGSSLAAGPYAVHLHFFGGPLVAVERVVGHGAGRGVGVVAGRRARSCCYGGGGDGPAGDAAQHGGVGCGGRLGGRHAVWHGPSAGLCGLVRQRHAQKVVGLGGCHGVQGVQLCHLGVDRGVVCDGEQQRGPRRQARGWHAATGGGGGRRRRRRWRRLLLAHQALQAHAGQRRRRRARRRGGRGCCWGGLQPDQQLPWNVGGLGARGCIAGQRRGCGRPRRDQQAAWQ